MPASIPNEQDQNLSAERSNWILPVELTEAIAKSLDSEDAKAFAETCKTFSNVANLRDSLSLSEKFYKILSDYKEKEPAKLENNNELKSFF